MNKKLFTLLPLLALGLVACGEKPAPAKPEHGSLEQPLTVAELLAKSEVQELEDKGETEECYYVTGVTTRASYDSTHDSFTVYLGTGEEDGPELQLYSLPVDASVTMEGDDDQGHWTYKATSAVKSATFIGYGKVYKYGTTLELHYQHEGKIVSIANATKVYPSTDTHGKAATDPLTFAEALAKIKALEKGTATDETYWFKAKIAKINTKPSSDYDNCGMNVNASGTEADTDVIELFRCYVDGHAKTQAFFDWFDATLTPGTEILINGHLMSYGAAGKPEVSNTSGKTGLIYLGLDAQNKPYGYVAAN